MPADKRSRTEFRVSRADSGGAKDGELVSAEVLTTARAGLPEARVVEREGPEFGGQTERLGANGLVLEPTGVRDEARVEGRRRGRAHLAPDRADEARDELAR